MRVTNKQIEAEIFCSTNDDCVRDCPFFGFDDCDMRRAFGIDAFYDLLEARALVKEAIQLFSKDEKNISVETVNQALAFLEKSKEYAE